MAAGNKSSSSLVHPVSFSSPRDSFLISRVWSCMCTWHLLADVTPPCPSPHIMHILPRPSNASQRTITMSVVLFKVYGKGARLFVAIIDFFSAAQMSFLFLWKLFIWKCRYVVTTLAELFSPPSKVTTSWGNSLCCHLPFCWFCQQKLIGVHFNSPRALISMSREISRPN